MPRCRWRRSGSLPEAKDAWVRQGTVLAAPAEYHTAAAAHPRLSALPDRTRRISTVNLTSHIHEAQSLEHLHRLSMLPGERIVVPVASDSRGSSFHIYHAGSGGGATAALMDQQRQSFFLERSEQLFLDMAVRGSDQSTADLTTPRSSVPSEIEF
ncbi:Aste57867_17812 [Aphanomyces stellatus]|uniref:Aste57867_17812 protein n=1 Tax=Aphanomyces stellatus TaxID=120398 RepID=A0A485L8K2_9STRA|nr:hypothetical protein As57867_017751 [Aphanomyces stellatus]VFT94555.1 Aste57867_17812 [Aphanomyces stellatus]